MPVANLGDELSLLQRLLDETSGTHVLTVTGQTLKGKTELLKEAKGLLNRTGIPYAAFNLKRRHNPHSVLDSLVDDLGYSSFGTYNEVSASYCTTKPSISLRGMLVLSRATIQGAEPPELADRYRHLTRSFVQDLQQRAQTSVVFMLDHYEKIDDDTNGWFLGEFLPRIERAEGTRMIIAGQMCPELDLDYATPHSIELSEIPLEEWQSYRDAIGSSITDEDLQRIWLSSNGLPGKMVGRFASQVR